MKEFLTWISTLSPLTLWITFGVVCLLLILYPNFSKLRRIFSIFFSFRRSRIKDFSWRHAEDFFLCTIKGKSYYWNPNGKSFIVEGGKIMLNWHVVGALRIDIEPIAQNVKGNYLSVIARQENNVYTLVAHTLWGTKTQELVIPKELYRTLQTINLSQDGHFSQRPQKLKRKSFLEPAFRGKRFTVKNIRATFKSVMNVPAMAEKRFYVKPPRTKLEKLRKWNSNEKSSLKKMFFFKPQRFNTIEIEDNEKLIEPKF